MTSQTISTAEQVVTIRTRRGLLRIGPHGRLDGLWRIVRRELRTNAEVRAMCAGAGNRGRPSSKPIQRKTFQRWRELEQFPAPVITLKVSGPPVELWSRSEVEDWLAARANAQPTN